MPRTQTSALPARRARLLAWAPAATLLTLAAVASADRPPHPPHHPPQEAIDACASGSAGAACSFTLPARDGSGSAGPTITGTCETLPDQTVLACKPDRPPPHDGDHPPPPPR